MNSHTKVVENAKQTTIRNIQCAGSMESLKSNISLFEAYFPFNKIKRRKWFNRDRENEREVEREKERKTKTANLKNIRNQLCN